MRTADFSYALPPDLIAQAPAAHRDLSRLLVLERDRAVLAHHSFSHISEYLKAGDLLVLNDSRVIPARLRGRNAQTGGNLEVFLIEENAVNDWWAMLRPAKRARPHTRISLRDRKGNTTDIQGLVIDSNAEGHRRIRFEGTMNILDQLEELGEVPLPPYIHRGDLEEFPSDRERYQTIYARENGSVAAPTAGLHFTDELLCRLQHSGIELCYVTLHVGPGTFAPVKSESLAEHVMHEERYSISQETAVAINTAKREGRRVIAVGTTSVRVLETAAAAEGQQSILSGSGRTRIFIHPPFRFQIVEGLITNFHLPCSTLLMLVSAFAAPGEMRGREMILSAYQEAIQQRYRFFSYGDAMLIL